MDDPEMYLHKRKNGFWYFRRRIPTDLLGIIDPKQFHYSLKTNQRREAVSRYTAALHASEREIALQREKIENAARHGHEGAYAPSRREMQLIKAARAKRHRSKMFSQYSESDVLNVISRWFEDEKRVTETSFRDAFLFKDYEARMELAKELSEIGGYLSGQLCSEDAPVDDFLISREVHSILESEDCEPPRENFANPLYNRFYGLVAEGMILLNEMAQSLVEKGTMPERFQKQAAFFTANVGPAPFAGKIVTLNELIQQFEKDPKRAHLREATRNEYSLIYRGLREEIGGEKQVAAITREDIKAVADTFLHLPSRATLRNPEVPLKSIAERAKREGLPKADVKTYNKKVHNISAIFKFAHDETFISLNPAKNLALPEPPSSGEGKGFDSAQLQKIFSGDLFQRFLNEPSKPWFTPNHKLRPCYYWMPLLGLYQGMRSGEILQLKVANVFERDGVTVLKSEGKVKNYLAFRIIPLHPKLIELGFLRYIENVRKAGFERVFPDAKMACDEKYSTWFQKPFANYLKRIGVKQGRKECFHAFRHTWNGGMRRVEVREEIRRALGGWKRADSAELNYGPEHYPRLLKDLAKLDFPGLDLSHLPAA